MGQDFGKSVIQRCMKLHGNKEITVEDLMKEGVLKSNNDKLSMIKDEFTKDMARNWKRLYDVHKNRDELEWSLNHLRILRVAQFLVISNKQAEHVMHEAAALRMMVKDTATGIVDKSVVGLDVKHGNTTRKGSEMKNGINKVSREEAGRLMRRALTAARALRERKNTSQNAPDPGEEWFTEITECYGQALKWAVKHFEGVDGSEIVSKIEEVRRSMENQGNATRGVYAEIIDEHFGDLEPDLLKLVKETVTNGVKLRIPEKPDKTERVKASKTAGEWRAHVWKEIRKLVMNGHVMVFPPWCQSHLDEHCRLRGGSLHYVPPCEGNQKGRLVWDGTKQPNNRDATSVNLLSPDVRDEEGNPYLATQTDYIKYIVEEILVRFAEDEGMTAEELIALKVDAKAAFLRVVLHLDNIGDMTADFEGWTLVWLKTAFGWKWASHTFSVLTRVLKEKVQLYHRHGWRYAEATLMSDSWMAA